MRRPQPITQFLLARVPFAIALIAFVTISWSWSSAGAANGQFTCTPSSLQFGTVAVGQQQTAVVTLTNTSQTYATISAVNVSKSEFSISSLSLPLTLSAGQSIDLSVTFAPTSTGSIGAKVTFASNGSGPILKLQLGGTGVTSAVVVANPSSATFGQVPVGTSSTLAVTLTNNGSGSSTLTALQTTGTGFTVNGPPLPLTLGAGQSVTLNVTFAPLSASITSGNVFVSGPSLNVPLSGTGTATASGQLTIAPTTLNFGSETVGATGTQTAVLSATGGSVTISSVASNNSQFSIPGLSLPLTVNAGQSIQFNVTFAPLNIGTASGTLSFVSNATNSLASESLSGTGAAPYVTLSWNPSTSPVVGYNVYRRISPTGSYAKINSNLDFITSFSDMTVALGQTYDYATTAVDASGQESALSNAVEVVIP